MIRPKNSFIVALVVLIVAVFLIIPGVWADPVVTNGIASETPVGTLIITPYSTAPFPAQSWNSTNCIITTKILPIPFTFVCDSGYCTLDSLLKNNSENGLKGVNITPYYPPKFWNYPPPGYMPLVPHTDPALYYSEASSAAGMTSGFGKGVGYLFR